MDYTIKQQNNHIQSCSKQLGSQNFLIKSLLLLGYLLL